MEIIWMSSIKVYETSHIISRTICRAFAPGCNAQVVPAVTLLDGVAACYGILRGTNEIINAAFKEKRDLYYIDLGYFSRSDHYHLNFDGYYRVTKNAYQHNGFGDYPGDRLGNLEIDVKPWKRKGEHILVFPLSYNFSVHRGMDHKAWLRDTIAEVSKYTDRPIMIKPKSSEMTLDEALQDCHAVVSYDSNAVVDAVIKGIPGFTLGQCGANAVTLSDLSKIENPIYPKRKQWLQNLSYNQWDFEEFKDGTCWRMLQENQERNKVPLNE